MPTKGEKKNPEQRIDLYVLNCYPSKNFEKIAFEIKVSRRDFLHEIKHPEKRQQALELSNYYYFATPKGMVKPEEIPLECGLVEISADSNGFRWTVKAPFREATEPTWRFVASLARMGQGQFKINNLKSQVKSLRRQVQDLKRTVEFRGQMIEELQRRRKSE